MLFLLQKVGLRSRFILQHRLGRALQPGNWQNEQVSGTPTGLEEERTASNSRLPARAEGGLLQLAVAGCVC
jgi:hypothetical protein